MLNLVLYYTYNIFENFQHVLISEQNYYSQDIERKISKTLTVHY